MNHEEFEAMLRGEREHAQRTETWDVNVAREGKWFMITVPALGLTTQALTDDEIGPMARSVIAVTLDMPAEEVLFEIVPPTKPGRP